MYDVCLFQSVQMFTVDARIGVIQDLKVSSGELGLISAHARKWGRGDLNLFVNSMYLTASACFENIIKENKKKM